MYAPNLNLFLKSDSWYRKQPRHLKQRLSFLVLLVSRVLNLFAAVGIWQLYSRVKRPETIRGLPAKPLSPQKSLQEPLPKSSELASNVAFLIPQQQFSVGTALQAAVNAVSPFRVFQFRPELQKRLVEQLFESPDSHSSRRDTLLSLAVNFHRSDYAVRPPGQFLEPVRKAYRKSTERNKKNTEISTLFPRIIPRGREVEFPLFHATIVRRGSGKFPAWKQLTDL